ncbi:nucleic acid dioxygenase ALKBH1 isoform X2 [Schistocerca gregaria]|uniref:nucleic acid dioxygenase ALKBH1 isoform X2 n=1 Tax=Schistocerca gregaria TaxID=7010 RepID=UPI00211E0776|nr:nucleic acid dioxygenase ALKBH1 isoform X2 [Schistocerca gregaria]
MFKKHFKYYKSKCPPPDLSNVINFRDAEFEKHQKVKRVELKDKNIDDLTNFGLKPINMWKMYEIADSPGFFVIPDPFTGTGQRYWIQRCLRDFTMKPHSRLNLDAHGDLMKGEDWWETCCKYDVRSQNLLKKLRWATLGYHHDWDTKVYSEFARDPFPTDLATVCKYVCEAVGFPSFSAEAAIVNFYHLDSTLSGHTDHSEEDVTAPLLSFSFGQTAIFLLGGTTMDDEPSAVYLHSGDVAIMSGRSRLCYHGVPRIVLDTIQPWHLELDRDSEDSWIPFEKYVMSSRINVNVRQVLRQGQKSLSSVAS